MLFQCLEKRHSSTLRKLGPARLTKYCKNGSIFFMDLKHYDFAEQNNGFSYTLRFEGPHEVKAVADVHKHHVTVVKDESGLQAVDAVDIAVSGVDSEAMSFVDLRINKEDMPNLIRKLSAYGIAYLTDPTSPSLSSRERAVKRKNIKYAIQAIGILDQALEN